MAGTDKPLVVVPGDDPVQIAGSPQLDRLEEVAQVRIFHDRPETVEEQVRRVEGAQAILNSRGHIKWAAETLARLPQLRMITTCSIGTDSIDLEAAGRQGIVVSNIPGKTAPVVAEHAFALMFALAKRVAYQTAQLKAGRWTLKKNVYLSDKTLGIVGTGAIGSEMARLARAVGMRVVAWTYHPTEERARELGIKFVALDDLLSASDVVSLHVKSTPESRHLIGKRELELMKPGALLVNTARGAVVDTDALIAALDRDHLGGAAVDVFDSEPLAADHPILACEQVVLTPHHADQTPEGIELLNVGAVDNVLAYFSGSPQNVVTPQPM